LYCKATGSKIDSLLGANCQVSKAGDKKGPTKPIQGELPEMKQTKKNTFFSHLASSEG